MGMLVDLRVGPISMTKDSTPNSGPNSARFRVDGAGMNLNLGQPVIMVM
jgi:hypothetical protein